MRKSYRALVKIMPILFISLVVGAILGTFTFYYDYDSYWINMSYLSVSFAIIVVVAFGFAIAGGILAKDSKIVRFRDNYNFSKFASVLLCLVTFSLFLIEFYKLVLPGEFIGFWRLFRLFLALGASVNFLFVAIRKKTLSKYIPRNVRAGFSIITVLWGVFSVFSIYFANNSISLANIVKVLLLLSYLSITVFMLFEAQFKHVKQIHIAYVMSALICAVFGCIFCFPITIGIASGKIVGYTVMEFVLCFVVGIYALSRVCAMIATMRYTIKTRSDNDNLSSNKHSKKVDKTSSSNSEEQTIKETKEQESDETVVVDSKEEPVKKASTHNHKAKYDQYPKSKKSGAKKSVKRKK